MDALEFVEHAGLIEVDLGPDRRGFNEALKDGVSALSPIGQQPALSTYWIDRTASRLERGHADLTSGNATRLIQRNGMVCAHSDYELFDDEEMRIEEFRSILLTWRAEVSRRIEAADPRRPDLAPYQRVPFPR